MRPMQPSRVAWFVRPVFTLSFFQSRSAGGTVDFGFVSPLEVAAGTGEAVPFGLFLPAGLLPLALCTSSRHFLTMSLASLATVGSLCCFERLTMTPILVERSKSSSGLTPVFNSFRMRMMFSGGSSAIVAF